MTEPQTAPPKALAVGSAVGSAVRSALWSSVLVLLALPALAQRPQNDSVRYGITKSRDTVTVGEPFEIRVRVRAPVDATIEFPENPDSTGTVQPRDPRVLVTTDSVQALDRTAIYRVSAWDIDAQPVRLGDVTVTWAGGTRRIPLGGIEVYVRSVLPADSALRVPKPARDLWEPRVFPWWILAALLAALAIGALLWWWWRRRRRPGSEAAIDPYVRAQREFNRLEAMGLVDAGERTRYAALVVEVLRDYLYARYPDAALSLTSRELVAMIRRHPTVHWELLSRVLHEADLAKFAGFALSEERARALARDARGLVDHDHTASMPAEREAA